MLHSGLLAITAKRSQDYVAKHVLQLQSTTDVSRLQEAWRKVIDLNPILRTRIMDLPREGMVQAILSHPIEWEIYTDLTEYRHADSQVAMGPGKPLLKLAIIFDNSTGTSYFSLTIHHSLYDGWSMSSLLDQVATAYEGNLSVQSTPFQLFVKHIREIPAESISSFWNSQFSGMEANQFPALPSLDYEPKADDILTHSIAEIELKERDHTMSTIIRAAWAILICRQVAGSEALFGSVTAGRQANIPGIERVAGPTVATVPIRIPIDWNGDIKQLLDQIQVQATDMIAFEQTGLRHIQALGGDAKDACSFQTLLVVQPPVQGSGKQNILFSPMENEDTSQSSLFSAFATYALTAECIVENRGIRMQLRFDSVVIGKKQVERLTCQFEHILRQICKQKNNELAIKDIESASEKDLRDIWTWNADVPKTVALPVHDLVLQAVHTQPDSQAVHAWDGQLTYKELDDLSTRLALHLLGEGIKPNTTVALCFSKSVHTPVAMLGVMKAGAVQVVLDVKQPPERLRAVLQEVGEPLILCPEVDKTLAAELSSDGKIIVMDNEKLRYLTPPSQQVLPHVDPNSVVYMIFTSGSTGRPKGVVINHANVSSALINQSSAREMDKNTRTLDFTSYGFDAAYFSLCHTLHAGGCICVPSDNQRLNDVGGAIRDLKATCALLPPSLLNSVDEADILRLTTIYLGGEPVPTTLMEKWHEKTHISIVYGPTECTIISTYWPTKIPVPSSGMLGKPSGLKAWIVDVSGSCLVGIGAVGEMWLEGPLVGQGYLNNPEQTSAAFFESPSWLLMGTKEFPGRTGRLYRTGDLVRYNEDGSLSFVGRKDGYVKIRGQRVDLGEVEHHVRQKLQDVSPRDGQWGVIAEVTTPSDSNRKMLVVFACPPGARGLSEEDLKSEVQSSTNLLNSRLSQTLPSYMVPSAYIPMTEIPLTATGKPDRRKLRRLVESLSTFEISAVSDEIVSPTTSMEEMIRDIWANVLNLRPESISVTVSFLELGGDSITAMQISSRCHSKNISLSVRDLLGLKTIQKVAAQTLKASVPTRNLLDDHPEGELTGLSPIQQWFFDCHPNGMDYFNQTFLFKLGAKVTASDVHAALREVVSRHPMLRSQFKKNERLGWQQCILPYSDDAFNFMEHQVEGQQDIEEICQWRQKLLNISSGCVFAIDVFNGVVSNDLFILFTAHHLVVDLVSWRIIWQDIEQFIRDKKPLNKTPSFLTWSRIQEEDGQNLTPSETLPSKIRVPDVSFWGVTPVDNIRQNSISMEKVFDEEMTNLLLGKSNEALQTEPIDIMLSTLIWTFENTFPERETPPIFLEGHGREPTDTLNFDLSEIVGWFTSMYPVQVNKQATLFDTLASVKDYRKSIANKGRPYFACRYHSQAGREAFESHGKAEISFNYTGRFQQLEQTESILQPIPLKLEDTSPMSSRLALIEINASVYNKKLHVFISLQHRMNHQPRLHNWVQKFADTLNEVTRTLKDAPLTFTPSDFPLLSISRDSINSIILELGNIGVPVSNIKDIYPATPIQNGIILSTKKQTASYQNSWVWKCLSENSGKKISPRKLQEAWENVSRRHSILSTIFIEHPQTGYTIQVLLHATSMNVLHLTSEMENPELVLKEFKQHSLPVKKPPYSLTICRGVNNEVACRLDMSHALIDASSLGILINDVMRAYSEELLPPAPAFRDVVEQINTRSEDERLRYWKEYLHGIVPCELPGVKKTKTTTEPTYGQVLLPQAATERILKFCMERQITRAMLLQVAWALTLGSMTGGDEVCFGYLSSGRDIEKVGQIVGPTISLMVSRVDLKKNLNEVISTTYRDSTKHFDYQHVSLADILHSLNLRGRRLFNTAMTIRQDDNYGEDKSGDIRFVQTYGEDPHEVK
jgi:amino acid adenylation domain-containing protein/non-ribosomal peptide synthase protein (TIGR01720 family)